MNNVMRNQPSYSDATPHGWMLAEVWTWCELGFTFETAAVRHTGVHHADSVTWLAVEDSFDETFAEPECPGHESTSGAAGISTHCDGSCIRARWGRD